MMDGYAIARLTATEVELTFALPQVRHVAELADGNTFVAFDGEPPLLGGVGGMLFEVDPATDFLFPLVPKIRRVAPVPGEVEYLALYAGGQPIRVTDGMQAVVLACDLIMTCTATPPVGLTVWSSYSVGIMDKRLAEVIV